MALSGNYTTIVPGTKSQLAIKISWSATQSVTANTSTVKTTVQLIHKSYGRITGASTKAYTLNVNGNKHTGSASINGSANTTSTITTSTDTINHTSTGVGKLAITFSISMGIAWSGVTVPTCNVATKYFALTTIPRQSTMSSVASTSLGSPVTMTITAHSSSYTHVIDARFGSTIIQTWKDLKAGKQSLTFNSSATSAITAKMGTVTSVQIDWVMSTHSGTTQIGSMATAKSTVSLPSSELAPTVGTISVSEANSEATSRFTAGSYVQNVSQLRLSVSGSSATHGATIKSTTISFEGKTYSSGSTSDVISGSGNLKVTATVTDSRGQSASKSITVLVTAYQPPQVITAIATRSNSSGGFVTDGQYCSVVYSVASSDLPLINGKNTLTLNFSRQEAGATSFTQVRTILVPDVKGEGTAVLGDGYDGTKDYTIKLVATDAAGMSTTVMIGLDVAHVLMSWGKTQVGIGKVAENGTLDVLGDIYDAGSLHIEGGGSFGGGLEATALTLSGVGGSATLTPDQIIQLNNVGKLLWSGAWGMAGSTTCTPSKAITDCLNGWMIVWSYGSTNAGSNSDWQYQYIPKSAATDHNGAGVGFPLHTASGGHKTQKYLYVSKTTLKGKDTNMITGESADFVMREVREW
ncbi:DUF859 domain-containing protein [Lacticaseibacillus parakribbianus]|uniref:DUF859 domain-containing protein n=1 Tax=Lacticaseibacillus parakribbianus TaxID=2970927 RepID=UPI0021CB12DA|nr:DUF859 domain-containing protein [Lacticaseibacillus parakribbianus]